MAEPSESKLLSVAASISDGAGVDWERVEQKPVDAHETQVLRELRVLDRIAAFHRSPEPPPVDPGQDDRVPSEGSWLAIDPSSHAAGAADPGGEVTDEGLQTWGHLAVLEKIGEGAFGAVYRARDDKLQREVALKLLWPAELDAPSSSSRALKEARLLARVRHPNVATVYGADQIHGRVGLWMELVKGRTLAELLRAHGPFSAREAALVGLDLCRALAAVHGAGLLHGDVKAHNVMREEGGRTVLMDFGTGKDLSQDRAPRHQGAADDFAGTPLYLAPEVFEGHARTKATDIYSLGVLLYHLVTGSYPVEGRTREEVERAHRLQERRHLRDVRPDLPEEFVHTVQRALDPDPRQRYQSAGAFESALARFLGATAEAERGWRSSSVRRITIVACTLGVVLAMGAVYWVAGRVPRRPGGDASVPPAELVSSPQQSASAQAAPSYTIDTALYRELRGQQVRLAARRARRARSQALRRSSRIGPDLRLHRQRRRARRCLPALPAARPESEESVAGGNGQSTAGSSRQQGDPLAGGQSGRARAFPHLREPRTSERVRTAVRKASSSGSRSTDPERPAVARVGRNAAKRGGTGAGGRCRSFEQRSVDCAVLHAPWRHRRNGSRECGSGSSRSTTPTGEC